MSIHLISTRAIPRKCPGCGNQILVGIDEGVNARADATPITPANEAPVLITGRRTYTLISSGYLIHRTAAHITSGQPRGTIHAEHKCQHPTLI